MGKGARRRSGGSAAAAVKISLLFKRGRALRGATAGGGRGGRAHVAVRHTPARETRRPAQAASRGWPDASHLTTLVRRGSAGAPHVGRPCRWPPCSPFARWATAGGGGVSYSHAWRGLAALHATLGCGKGAHLISADSVEASSSGQSPSCGRCLAKVPAARPASASCGGKGEKVRMSFAAEERTRAARIMPNGYQSLLHQR